MLLGLAQGISSTIQDVQTELITFFLGISFYCLFFRLGKLTPAPGFKSLNSQPNKNQRSHPAGTRGAAPDRNLQALKGALKAGNLEVVLKLLEAHACPMHLSTASIVEQIVKLAAQKGALSELIQLLTKVDSLDSTLHLVIANCPEQSEAILKQVEEIRLAQDMTFSSATYQALIQAASNCGAQEDAQRLILQARQAGVADVRTYAFYMTCLLKWHGKKWDMESELTKVMEYMRIDDLRPSTITFNKLITTAIDKDISNVWTIVGAMQSFNVKPDQCTCTCLLKGKFVNSKTSNIDRALSLVNALEGDMDEVLFSSAIDSCARVKRPDLMMPIINRQRASKNVISKGSHTYASIIRACGYVRDVNGAWEAWQEMCARNIAPLSVTLGCMVEALVTNGDLDGGYRLIQETKQDEKIAYIVNATVYGSIIKGLSHATNYSRMWEVYDEMVAQKLKFSMVTYNTLIDACARSGQLGRIPSLLLQLDKQGLKMCRITYSAIIKGYCQKNQLDKAFKCFEDMSTSSGLTPDEVIFNTLLNGLAKQGCYERGLCLLQKMKEHDVRPSNFTVSVIVKLANRSGKLDEAFKISDELSSEYNLRLNDHVYANLVQACCQHGDLERGIDVLERMLQEGWCPLTRMYSVLFRSCIQKGEITQVDGLLRAALGLSGAHPRLAQFKKAAWQPQDGLPGDLVSEILAAMMTDKEGSRLAAALLADMSKSGLKLDPKWRLRLLARTANI